MILEFSRIICYQLQILWESPIFIQSSSRFSSSISRFMVITSSGPFVWQLRKLIVIYPFLDTITAVCPCHYLPNIWHVAKGANFRPREWKKLCAWRLEPGALDGPLAWLLGSNLVIKLFSFWQLLVAGLWQLRTVNIKHQATEQEMASYRQHPFNELLWQLLMT